MSQHDMTLDNASGAAFRADANAALQALASTSKGNTAPATPYAGQHWIDDNTPGSSKWSEFVFDGTDWIKLREIDATNNVSVQQVGGGTSTIASAATTDLGGNFEASITVSGTTTITSLGSSTPKGAFKFVTFAGTLTLTHNATSLILPGGANITTAAADTLLAEHYGSGNWRVHHYSPATGRAVGDRIPKIGTFTRDTSLATGTQDITGLGFTPREIDFLAVQGGASPMSVGFATAAEAGGVADVNANIASSYQSTNSPVHLYGSAGNYVGNVSMLADGFRMNWVKAGTTNGTATITYRAR